MIINLRGTSGCGKSYLVRQAMASYEETEPYFVENRQRPIGYLCSNSNCRKPLWVIGHYETPCGGCDTISSGTLNYVYETVREMHSKGCHVIYEGLVVTSDTRRCIDLHTDGFPVLVIAIDETIETCIESITARRLERGDERPVNPRNTISKYWATVAGMQKLQEADVDARWLERSDALKIVLEALT